MDPQEQWQEYLRLAGEYHARFGSVPQIYLGRGLTIPGAIVQMKEALQTGQPVEGWENPHPGVLL